MADKPDENTEEFSLKEQYLWNVEQLQNYLKACGIVITTEACKCNSV